MSIDLRAKHDLESRRRGRRALRRRRRLQAGGRGPVRPPRDRERNCGYTGRSEARRCCPWTGNNPGYMIERYRRAASAVVDGGMAKSTPWPSSSGSKSAGARVRPVEAALEALRPRPKGRSRGSRSKPRLSHPRAGARGCCRRLEAEVAYLALRALVERDGL